MMRKVRVVKYGQQPAMSKPGYSRGFNSGQFPVYYPGTEWTAPKTEVFKGIQPVDWDDANVEAEGGETAYILDQGGLPAHFNINGPRHSEGGVPLNLPQDSFIYSDTSKMRIGGPILDYFGKGTGKTKKKYTPAELAKQYDINKYRKVLQDPDSDQIQRHSAELMIANYNKKLGALALVQEAKKGFPDGIPAAAMPYMASYAIQPQQVLPQVGQQMPQGEEAAEQSPMANMGMQVPNIYNGAGRVNYTGTWAAPNFYQMGGTYRAQTEPEFGNNWMSKARAKKQYGGEGTDDQSQILQIIQAYAQAVGQDPDELVAQLQQMDPQEAQQAIAKMAEQLQQGQQSFDMQPSMYAYGGNVIPKAQAGKARTWSTYSNQNDPATDYWSRVNVGNFFRRPTDQSEAQTTDPRMQEALEKLIPFYGKESDDIVDWFRTLSLMPQKELNNLLTGYYETPSETMRRYDPNLSTTTGVLTDILTDPLIVDDLIFAAGRPAVKALAERAAINKAATKTGTELAGQIAGKTAVGPAAYYTTQAGKYVAEKAPEVAAKVAKESVKAAKYAAKKTVQAGKYVAEKAPELAEKLVKSKLLRKGLDKAGQIVAHTPEDKKEPITPTVTPKVVPQTPQMEPGSTASFAPDTAGQFVWGPQGKIPIATFIQQFPNHPISQKYLEQALQQEEGTVNMDSLMRAAGLMKKYGGYIPKAQIGYTVTPTDIANPASFQVPAGIDPRTGDSLVYDVDPQTGEKRVRNISQTPSFINQTPPAVPNTRPVAPITIPSEFTTPGVVQRGDNLQTAAPQIVKPTLTVKPTAKAKAAAAQSATKANVGTVQEVNGKYIYINPQGKAVAVNKEFADKFYKTYGKPTPPPRTAPSQTQPAYPYQQADDWRMPGVTPAAPVTTAQEAAQTQAPATTQAPAQTQASTTGSGKKASSKASGNIPYDPSQIPTDIQDIMNEAGVVVDPSVLNTGVIGKQHWDPAKNAWVDEKTGVSVPYDAWVKNNQWYLDQRKSENLGEFNPKDKKHVAHFEKAYNDYTRKTVLDELKKKGLSEDKANKVADYFVNNIGFINKPGALNHMDRTQGNFHNSRIPLKFLDQPAAPATPAQAKPEEKGVLQRKYLSERPDAPWWLQDMVNVQGLAGDFLRTKKYLPWAPKVEPVIPDVVFYDPTRELAANAEQMAIGTQGAGAFGSPQQFNARFSQMQGKGAENAANIMGRYNTQNVGVANQFAGQRAGIYNNANMANARIAQDLYDKTTVANQQFDNTRKADRVNLREGYINAITNRANAQVINALYPHYGLDPTTGGFINFEQGSEMTPGTASVDYSDFDKFRERYKGVDPEEFKAYMYFRGLNPQSNTKRNPFSYPGV